MSNQAIKVSKEGFDVKVCKDNELLLHSSYPFFKVHKQGSDKVSVSAGTVKSYTIPHQVGKIPMHFIRGQVMLNGVSKSTEYRQYPHSAYFGTGLYGFEKYKPYSNRIEIYWYYPGVSVDISFDYIIFEDPILL